MNIFNLFSKKPSDDRVGDNRNLNNLIKEIEKINGWLAPEAAYFTGLLLDFQKAIGLSGNILEIGVFHGKYLALLYHYLDKADEYLFGIDAFIGSTDLSYSMKIVIRNLFNIYQDDKNIEIIAKDSLTLSPSQLLESMNGRCARFISIDGGHTKEVVSHDIYLSNALLQPGGVIAMDDIFNHTLPGVTEGLFDFMLKTNNKNLAPFVHCYNKLFITTPDHHERYLEKAFEILERMKQFEAYQRTKSRINENSNVDFFPELFGYKVLCFL